MVITKDAQSCSQMVRIAGEPNRACSLLMYLKRAILSIFQPVENCIMRREDQGAYPEADFIRALSYLWSSARGRLCTAYRCSAHRATPRSKAFRSRGRGNEGDQTVEIEWNGLEEQARPNNSL